MASKPLIDWRKLDLDNEADADAFDQHVQEVAKAAGKDAATETAAARVAKRTPLPAK